MFFESWKKFPFFFHPSLILCHVQRTNNKVDKMRVTPRPTTTFTKWKKRKWKKDVSCLGKSFIPRETLSIYLVDDRKESVFKIKVLIMVPHPHHTTAYYIDKDKPPSSIHMMCCAVLVLCCVRSIKWIVNWVTPPTQSSITCFTPSFFLQWVSVLFFRWKIEKFEQKTVIKISTKKTENITSFSRELF